MAEKSSVPSKRTVELVADPWQNVDADQRGLYFLGDIPFDQWQALGIRLRFFERAMMWWIGDWVTYGERAYGEMYAQALDATDYSYQALRDAAYVSSRFELSRRRDNLSWSHHREVASLEPIEQDEMLDTAVAEKWSTRQLREAVQERKRAAEIEARLGRLPPQVTERYQLIHTTVEEAVAHIVAESVDTILTDPPYAREHLEVYRSLSKLAAHALKPGGWAFFMVGQSYVDLIMPMLAEYLTYCWIVAYLTPGGQSAQLWDRHVNTFWKPILWYVKGGFTGPWAGDVAQSAANDNDKRFHAHGQSLSGMGDVVEKYTNIGEVVYDPCVGGGTTAVACISRNRRFIGSDQDESAIKATLVRLSEIQDVQR